MIKDKKNNSEKINLVLLKKIGKPIFNKQYSKKKLNLFLKKFLLRLKREKFSKNMIIQGRWSSTGGIFGHQFQKITIMARMRA